MSGWRPLFDAAASRADEVQPGLHAFLAAELDYLSSGVWPNNLPEGVIHADLFNDNVFFLGDKLSGIIDFTFACNDMLAYDVAICLNAWCFEPDHSFNVTKARAFLNAYGRVRKLSEPEEAALPLLARRRDPLPADAAGRLAQRPSGRAGQAEGSAGIFPQAALSPERVQRARLRADAVRTGRVSELPIVTIYTDGACSGNPGPGGWGAILKFGDKEKELNGGERHTTNNQMELMAAISALEALKKPCTVDLYTDSQYVRQGITGWIHGWKRNGWRTADKKPVKNVELWQRLDAALKAHDVRWHWVKGHAGHPENERADQLARDGIVKARTQQRVTE